MALRGIRPSSRCKLRHKTEGIVGFHCKSLFVYPIFGSLKVFLVSLHNDPVLKRVNDRIYLGWTLRASSSIGDIILGMSYLDFACATSSQLIPASSYTCTRKLPSFEAISPPVSRLVSKLVSEFSDIHLIGR